MFWQKIKNVQFGFKKLTPDKYRVLLAFEVQSSIIKRILKKNSDVKTAEVVLSAIDEIKTFYFAEDYLKHLKIAIGGQMREIINQMQKSGIHIYDFEVTKDSKYNVVGDMHHCYLIIEGSYK